MKTVIFRRDLLEVLDPCFKRVSQAFLFQEIPAVIPLQSLSGPRDHFEVPALVLVTIPNPDFNWL
jgi:hypothetical protein